jgi:PTH1 family peptidyl-tRNA hydrolase
MSEQAKLIIGLGNPGPRYENTKHNVGFRVIDELLRHSQSTKSESLCQSLVARTDWHGWKMIFAKPLTYMNNSGQAVRDMVHRFDIPLDNVCVVYDDLHLDIGVLRMRRSGSDGGHKGMKSICHLLGTQAFPRFRIGIGKPATENWMDHVLSEFSPTESAQIDYVIQRAAEAIETFITDGIQSAMNRFNERLEKPENP